MPDPMPAFVGLWVEHQAESHCLQKSITENSMCLLLANYLCRVDPGVSARECQGKCGSWGLRDQGLSVRYPLAHGWAGEEKCKTHNIQCETLLFIMRINSDHE